MEEVESKYCPYLVGLCRRELCQLWISGFSECGLVVAVTRDEQLKAALKDAEDWRQAAELSDKQAAAGRAQGEVLEGKLASMVPRAELENVEEQYKALAQERNGLNEELKDARASLEEARKKSGAKARRKKKPAKRES